MIAWLRNLLREASPARRPSGVEAQLQQTLRRAGMSSAPVGTYTRMFPRLRWKLTRPPADVEEGLRELGRAMRDTEPPIEPINQPDVATAGYTYWGQFVDHDLTLDLTPLDHVSSDVAQIRNFRTPLLDLDNLYGGGPSVSPFLYERGSHSAERFLVGKTTPDETPNDLPRNEQGIALVGDPRQDENLIIAQFHVAFLKLHNLVIGRRAELEASPHYLAGGATDFVAAQRIVRWHYQYTIRHDFMTRLLDRSVVDELPQLEREAIAGARRKVGMPVEFSAAAFRFGHSMVRDVYKSINRHHEDVNLATLLARTGAYGGAAPRLPAEWVVDWNRFFEIPPNTSHLSRIRKIDTQVALGLHQLEEPTVKQFNVLLHSPRPLEVQLPVRTLLRGYRLRLPSGEDVAERLLRDKPGTRRLTEDEIIAGPHKEILSNPRYGFRGQTPLWYYILKEAEVLNNGRRLGPVGSYIVARVLLRAIAAAEDSYFGAPGWQPTLDRGDAVTMARILNFVSRASTRSNT